MFDILHMRKAITRYHNSQLFLQHYLIKLKGILLANRRLTISREIPYLDWLNEKSGAAQIRTGDHRANKS